MLTHSACSCVCSYQLLFVAGFTFISASAKATLTRTPASIKFACHTAKALANNVHVQQGQMWQICMMRPVGGQKQEKLHLRWKSVPGLPQGQCSDVRRALTIALFAFYLYVHLS